MSQIPPEAEITSTIAVRHYGVIVENNSDVNEDAGQRSGNRDRGQSSVKPKMGQRLHSFLKRANSRYRSQKGSPIKPNMDLKMYWFLERVQNAFNPTVSSFTMLMLRPRNKRLAPTKSGFNAEKQSRISTTLWSNMLASAT